MEHWLINQILGNVEYGTDEYWVKERRSKFRRNARQKAQQAITTTTGIVGLWTAAKKVEMPLYSMLVGKEITHTVNDKWIWTIKQ